VADAEKTEQATPQKRSKAREEGQFARARDAGGLAAGIGVLLVIAAFSDDAIESIRSFTTLCLTQPYELLQGDPAPVLQRAASTLMTLIFPAAFAAAVAATAIGFAEAGFHPNLSLVAPKWERVSPFGKLGSLFSPTRALPELALAVARITVLGWVAWITVKSFFPTFTRMARAGVGQGAGQIADAVTTLTLRATLALAILSGLDYLQSRYRINKQLMMSKQEVKDEFRQQEGDVASKQRMRSRARERIRNAVAKQVREADVVLANPTHVAAAVRYRPDEGAPVLVAKGYDDLALHIRTIARENGIPVIEAPPLARALASRVRIGRSIPMDLYSAVAQILAFVYRLKGRVPWAA
jgi:flagellar biosynthetic protein FlhB